MQYGYTGYTHAHMYKLAANSQNITKPNAVTWYMFSPFSFKICCKFHCIFFSFLFPPDLQQVNQQCCFCETGGIFPLGMTVAQEELPITEV